MLLNPRYVTATSSSSGSTPTKHFVRHRRSKQRRGKLVNIGPGKSGSKVAELGIIGVNDISRNTIMGSEEGSHQLISLQTTDTILGGGETIKVWKWKCAHSPKIVNLPRNLVDTFIRDPTAWAGEEGGHGAARADLGLRRHPVRGRLQLQVQSVLELGVRRSPICNLISSSSTLHD